MISNLSYAMSCSVIGDSIAYGTAKHLSKCWVNAKIGLNTRQAIKRFLYVPYADVTVISLGINDKGKNIQTEKNLISLRKTLHSSLVVWILPPDLEKNYIVKKMAWQFKDAYIDLNAPFFKKYISQVDHIHPTGKGYLILANCIKNLLISGKHFEIHSP